MLKIYGVPVSVHTRKVIVVALHKGLDHVVQPVVPVIPDSLPANWRSFSPTGLIPAMTDDGLTLADSTAICVYLDRQYPHSPLYPATTRDFARTLAFEQYAGHLFSELVRPLFHETVVHPRMRNIPSDQARIQDLLSRVVPEKFHYLDGQLRGDWLVGNAPTVADIAVASNLINFRYLGFELERDRYPRLAGHLERVLRLPAVAEAMTRERPAADSLQLDRSWHVQDR